MPVPPEQRSALIKQLHAAPLRLVMNVTGGGSLAISDLLTIPGGSRILLAAHVPYSQQALVKILGKAPEQACSELTARQLAMAAWHEASMLAGKEDSDLATGLGCTASLASDRPKRGEHRIHLALQTANETRTWSLTLGKDQRTRGEEERLAGDAILTLVATNQQCGNDSALKLSLLDQEKPCAHEVIAPATWRPLLDSAPYAVSATETVPLPQDRVGRTIFPGSYAPLHDGHREIAALAEKRTGKPVIFEIAARNVDKPPLDYIELTNRAEQFEDRSRVWLTTTPTFVEKAQLFPRATFVVGDRHNHANCRSTLLRQ